ncbi:hypothetical protein SDRG_15318 [Saprolegnia diclina VS20]|uniref:Uncharacterized protein n=1 Tax=Saprolegnia diclina (strain VS20) TaxID=1156394 RepID=T0PX24_SAPDV|nr:hypothetical protein SDRG_15318 [Saprolegnia diclina VS20]EQC26806.1 hypothetical protein SDRG_15318 [Saprolegnia diclina VS20]|eukprot:XP_008619708.1 hypothetical protein SDRG_15318 [Saprolegnia diclina VS20]
MLVKGQSHFLHLVPRAAGHKGLCEVLVHLGPAALDLERLSNESDGVRDVAMHAGSIVVNAHALSNLLALEAGIFDDNWRIRESPISLLGDLMHCVMPEVGPILRAGLDPMDPADMRQGYCLGLAEVIQCSPKNQLEDFVEIFVVEDALCDALPEVRRAAGDAFDVFHKGMGYRSIDELIPRLLKRITSVYDLVSRRCTTSSKSAQGQIARHASVPRTTLLTTPTALSNIQAIVSVSGAVLHCDIYRLRKSARSTSLHH